MIFVGNLVVTYLFHFVVGCKLAAKGFFSATQTMGCLYYKQAQEKACYCPDKHKKKADEL